MTLHVRPSGAAASVRCRPIEDGDIDEVVRLLARGFRERSEAYWRRGLARHLARPLPDGCPRLGFVIESDGRPVGVVVTLYSAFEADGRVVVRCNLSSWYVEPAFRAYAALLDHVAMRNKAMTFLNISAAPHTWPMHEARGFRRYCSGGMLVFPLLGGARPGVRIREVAGDSPMDDLPEAERRLVADHAGYGCVCLVGTDAAGSRPFLFVRRPMERLQRRLGWSPVSYFHLVYCRSTADLPAFARGIGKILLRRHAMPWIVVDAAGPIAGLKGRFVEGWGAKFARGPNPAAPGDLAYTELVLFGP